MLIPVIFVIAGAALIAAAIRGGANRRRFEAVARETTGTVTGVRWKGTGSDAGPSAFPVVRFSLPDGRTVEAQSTYGGRMAAKEGTTVTVLYDPADPTRIALPGAGVTGVFFNALFVFLGVSLLSMGIITGAVLFLFRDAF